MNRTQISRLPALLLGVWPCVAHAQNQPAAPAQVVTVEQVRQLSQEVQAAEQRVLDSERELTALKARLISLESALQPAVLPAASPAQPVAATADAAEAVEMQGSQIATLDQIKVETSSKFPLKVDGMVLLTAGINSSGVDSPVDPTASLGGAGSTALSLRQTILGLDAVGPRLGGARSSADIHIDFWGATGSSGYSSAGGLLRLRTAHVALDWPHAKLFFSFDRTLLNPNAPSSLVQVAEPGLSWSGNLWNWMPQLGVSSRFGQRHVLAIEGAWLSPPDAPYPATPYSSTRSDPATLVEASRIPSGEARIGYETGDSLRGLRVGMGGYVSPHKLPGIGSFNSWAVTLDLRIPAGRRADFAGSFYRGAGLGGLGAGGYKDWVSYTEGTQTYLHAPEDVGGWAQLAIHLSRMLDWNNAFGMDNVFGGQLRSYSVSPPGYGSIARNRTVTSNLIWSPRPYLPFSFEYRRLYTAPVVGRLWNADVFAFGTGYRF
jgi:hypothetical protein